MATTDVIFVVKVRSHSMKIYTHERRLIDEFTLMILAVIQQDSGIISLKHSAGTDLYSMLDSLNFNSTHVIRHLNFGPFIPGMTVPLIDVHKVITDNGT